VLTWVSGFDIIYALQDDEFDKSHNLHSVPSVAGIRNAIIISVMVHVITFALVILAGFTGDCGWFYWAGATLFSLFLLYQHLIVKPDDLSRVNLAFGTTNGIASILFAIFVILDLFFRS
jgi:4-hydroxybenzoate polyprenyltransferase